MKKANMLWLFLGLIISSALLMIIKRDKPSAPPPPVAAKPALNIEVIQPQMLALPITLRANGSLAAWQEAAIAAQVGGLRLIAINAQVGDQVRKGQVLAEFDQERINVDISQSQASLAEAEANLADARLNVARVRQVLESGALSQQQIDQYLTTEKTAEARMRNAKAQLDQQLLRLRHAKVLAIDDGVISSRNATLGAVVSEGQELFRLIRQNRLEWRAEVIAAELNLLKPGQAVKVEVSDTGSIIGKLRSIAPTVNEQNRNALVYVDLPNAVEAGFKPGMFAGGEFQLGRQSALTVPQTALSLREGFSYVFRLYEINGELARVNQVKVTLGRQDNDRVEILTGITADDKLVASGGSFLSDGDSVRLAR